MHNTLESHVPYLVSVTWKKKDVIISMRPNSPLYSIANLHPQKVTLTQKKGAKARKRTGDDCQLHHTDCNLEARPSQREKTTRLNQPLVT